MLRRGHILKESYRVEKALSCSKEQYLAKHVSLQTDVVVEVVTKLDGVEELEYKERQEFRRQFAQTQERLQKLAALNNPNLARVLDSFEQDGVFYLVREWIEGTTLRELVETSLKPLDQATALQFADQALNLIDYLCGQNPPLVLGTLCPDYLVVRPEGELVVVDFGLNNVTDRKAEFEPFGCPELLGGAELDRRADLYSLGAVLYFVITGRELPPIWDRITYKDSLPSPLELEVKVDGSFWTTLESLVNLNVGRRPQTVDETRALFQNQDFEETAESSPASWYPEQADLMLADRYPFGLESRADWILKVVQAASVGRARMLLVTQGRDACRMEIRMAASDLPAPKAILEGLTTDAPIANSMAAEIVAALRTVGEYRDFRITLDDWKQSWSLRCRGGKLESRAGESLGQSGIYLKVDYEGKNRERVEQSAEELTRLVRRTRLCQFPIRIGKKPLEVGRAVGISEHSASTTELYLASASFPVNGRVVLASGPDNKDSDALTEFLPKDGTKAISHVDVRCLIEPSETTLGQKLHKGYQFIRKPSRVLWYRHGVLCAEQVLEKALPLQLDLHINGDHLQAENCGLKIETPSWIQASRLKPFLELSQVLPLVRMKLTEHWEHNPTDSAPQGRAIWGALSAPLMILFFGKLVGPGLALLKSATLSGLLKTSAFAGAATGFATARDAEMAVRKTCLKALEAFEKESF